MNKDGAYTKKTRLNQISRYIASNIPVAVKTVSLYCEINIGLSEYTALRYIKKICEAYGYEIKDDVIKAVPKNDA